MNLCILNKLIVIFLSCSKGKKVDNDVYNFGFILFESLVGPITCDKGEAFFLNDKVSKNFRKIFLIYEML